jgi:hypothetical protein
MSQAALFQTPVSVQPSGEDPLIDMIQSFSNRAEAFCSDLTYSVDEYIDETLYDVMQLRKADQLIGEIVGVLTKRQISLREKAQKIIDDCLESGHILEGNLQIISKESQGRRSVDRDLLIKERKDVYDLLLNTKIESIKIDYTPTIADIKTILKKRHEDYLKPGEITVTYDIAVILPEGEKID